MLAILADVVSSAQAVVENARPPEWYTVVVGIIGVPAALLGLIYSFFLIRKTSAESRKAMIEARRLAAEDKAVLKDNPSAAALELAEMRSSDSRRNAVSTQFILLRFIVLYLLIQVYGLITEAYDLLLVPFRALIFYAAQGVDTDKLNIAVQVVLYGLNEGLGRVPEIGYWLIFFAVGWPLFKDANEVVGVNIRDIFRMSKGKKPTTDAAEDEQATP